MRFLLLFYFSPLLSASVSVELLSEMKKISKEYVSTWSEGHSQTVHSACRLAKYSKKDLEAEYLRFPVSNIYYQTNKSHIDLILKKR